MSKTAGLGTLLSGWTFLPDLMSIYPSLTVGYEQSKGATVDLTLYSISAIRTRGEEVTLDPYWHVMFAAAAFGYRITTKVRPFVDVLYAVIANDISSVVADPEQRHTLLGRAGMEFVIPAGKTSSIQPSFIWGRGVSQPTRRQGWNFFRMNLGVSF
jgi:hypothetical protein